MRRSNRKRILLIVILVLIGIVLLGFWFFGIRNNSNNVQTSNNVSSQNTKTETKTETSKPKVETIRLIAVGDQLPHEVINLRAKTSNGYDYLPFFSEVRKYFDKSDVRFCNQEVPSAGESFGITGYPVFNAPEQFAKDINTFGCDVINVATNHSFDKGQAGIDATRTVWDSLKKNAIAGANRNQAEQSTIQYFTIKGVKFAFLAYAEYSNIKTTNGYTLNIYSADVAGRQAAEARKNADIVIVSMHWGTEYSKVPNGMQKNAVSNLAANGVDIIIGTGPHVVQPVAKIAKAGGGETLVWYSIGNFLNAQLDIDSLISGIAVMDFTVTDNKPTLSKVGFMPTYMHYEWTPTQKANEDLLTRTNFKLYPLDLAAEAMAKSQNNTTVSAQTANITAVINEYMPVTMYTSKTY